MRMRRLFFFVFYHAFAKHLPENNSAFKVGQAWLRRQRVRHMGSFCGNNVTVEKNAVFSMDLRIGDHSGLGINSRIISHVVIGKDVMMGPDVLFFTANHSFESYRSIIDLCCKKCRQLPKRRGFNDNYNARIRHPARSHQDVPFGQ